jgi:subtilisin family serine protease
MKVCLGLLICTLILTMCAVAGGERTHIGAGGVRLSGHGGSEVAGTTVRGSAIDNRLDPMIAYVSRISALSDGPEKNRALAALANPASLAVVETSAEGKLMMPLLIRTDDVQQTTTSVRSSGGSVSTVAGDIVVATLPLEAIRSVAEGSGIRAVQASTRRFPMLNVSHLEVKADKVHSGVSLPQAYRGGGVVAGILDTGIDWQHPDFKTSSISSRIRYLWDVSGSTNPPSEFLYGREYTKSQIDAGQCFERDGNGGNGHGTHVAATVAGNARALAGYTGIAPEADIIFVKGIRDSESNGGFRDDDVVNGCDFIFKRAQTLGEPAVINLSLGGHYGPHDGSSNYEQALTNLTGPGKIIVAAAGNEAGSPHHLRYTTGGDVVDSARQTFWVIPSGSSAGVVDLWYQSGSMMVGLAAYDHSLNFIGYTTPVSPGNKIENLPFTVNTTTYGYVTVDATVTSDPNNGAHRVLFVVDSNGGAVDIGQVYWVVYTYGSGTLDAWVVTGGNFTTDSNPSMLIMPGDNVRCVGMPSTALGLISIGSYVTKNQWVDIDGVTRLQGGNPSIGAISTFSNIGPSRDGRIKPDLAAPGEVIVSALSSFLTIGAGVDRPNILLGGQHQKMQGTSMASPHVAGAVALLLDAAPSLTPDSARSILKLTARADAGTGAVPNNIFGAGRLDVHEAVKRAVGGGGGGDVLALRNFDPGTTQRVYTLDAAYPIDSGFVFGTNRYGDKVKATCLSLPVGTTSGQLTDVKVWFGYKRAGLTSQTYAIRVYNGTAVTGPTGAPLYSQTFNLSGILADDVFATTEQATTHTLTTPVSVGQSFFVAVDFGAYTSPDFGDAAIVTTALVGSRVPEEWEQWQNNAWSNISDAWYSGGTDGWRMWLEATVQTGATDVREEIAEIPRSIELRQNYPNPFNPTTTIEYTLTRPMDVRLAVYDLLGREVATLVDGMQSAGVRREIFDASPFAAGVYYYVLRTEQTTLTKPMLLLK